MSFVELDRTQEKPGAEIPINEYVRKHICHRQTCGEYKEDDTRLEQDLCMCGQPKIEHQRNDTKSTFPPAYGTIEFTGYGKRVQQNVPYLKVDNCDNPKYISHIWTVMQNYWGLSPPRLVIVITGGAKRFDLQPRLSKALKTGLVNCSASTGAWLLTGGTKTGVRELVGEAVRDHYMTETSTDKPVVALGVTTWNMVAKKELLQSPQGKGLYPARYDIEGVTDSKTGVVSNKSLDPNHTHFLFVDKNVDGEGKVGFSNSSFRAALVNHMKMPSIGSQNKDQHIQVPKVLVIINGGVGTVHEILKNVTNGKIPTVIVKGSGRAADYVARAFEMVKYNGDEEIADIPPDFDERMTQYAQTMFEWRKDMEPSQHASEVKSCVMQAKKIVQCKELVTIYNLDSEFNKDLDTAILHALFKAHKSDLPTQLHFALSWNKADIALEDIFSIETKQQWKKQEYCRLLHDGMFRALCYNQVEFVEMFLENGVGWDKFLSVNILKDLYYETLMKKTSQSLTADLVYGILQSEIINEGNYPCCKSSDSEFKSKDKLLASVGELVAILLEFFTGNMYKGKSFMVQATQNYENHVESSSARKDAPMCKYATRDLFIWSVLLNRRDLAFTLWKESDNCLASALVASFLLKALSKRAMNNLEIGQSDDLQDHARVFEQHAIGVLHECFNNDRQSSHLLLVRENEIWGNSTVMNIAAAANHMDFMEQAPCQTKLSKIWYGKMVQYTGIGKVIGCMLCPFVIFGIKFTESSEKPEDMKMMKNIGELGATMVGTENHVSPEGDPDDVIESDEKDKVYVVRCCGGCGDQNSISFVFALIYFLHAPVVKFGYHTIFNLLFLGLFSYFVIIELRPRGQVEWISISEYAIWAYACTTSVEELRQMYFSSDSTLLQKLSAYYNDIWNIFDQLASMLLIVSIVLRLSLTESDDFVWARITYCISLIFYYLRFLQAFYVEKNLGPKIIMINRMLKDLMFFVLIILLFLLCYGTVSQALRNPNAEPSWIVLRNIVFEPYWNVYGELFLEDIEAERTGCSTNDTAITLNPNLKKCPQPVEMVVIYLCFAIYMLMSNILLLNLLIAMFSHTFQKVQDNAEKVWRFYRFSLVSEYNDRPTLPPPFIIINHIHRIITFLWRKMKNIGEYNTEFRMELSEAENNKLSTLEKLALQRYLHNLKELEEKNTEKKVTNTGKRVEKLSEDMQLLKESALQREGKSPQVQQVSHNAMSSQRNDIEDMKSSLSSLQSQMDNITKLLNEMVSQNTERKQGLQRSDSHLKTWVATYNAGDIENCSESSDL